MNGYENAYRIIVSGLRLDPWNYRFQRIAAEIEMMNGEYVNAYNRLTFVINNLRELALIYEASVYQRNLINIEDMIDPPVYLPNHYVYIATYPGLDSSLVRFLAARISEEYGIKVKVINVGAALSSVNKRDHQLRVYGEIIDDIRSRYSRPMIENFLAQIGLTYDDLDSREGKRKFVYALLNQSEGGRAQWMAIEATRSQYDANMLLNQLYLRFGNYLNAPYCLGILAITHEDIFANDFLFLFGWAQRGLGVMSYARFLLDNPTREQFEKRVVMQAFSSVGHIIGIPRCTFPDCARAFPDSLEEHDRKEDRLCMECRSNLRELYLNLR